MFVSERRNIGELSSAVRTLLQQLSLKMHQTRDYFFFFFFFLRNKSELVFCSSCLFCSCLGAPWRWFTTVMIRIMAAKETRINNMTRARCRAHVGGHVSWLQDGCGTGTSGAQSAPFSQSRWCQPVNQNNTHLWAWIFACVRVSRYPVVYALPTVCAHWGILLHFFQTRKNTTQRLKIFLSYCVS